MNKASVDLKEIREYLAKSWFPSLHKIECMVNELEASRAFVEAYDNTHVAKWMEESKAGLFLARKALEEA